MSHDALRERPSPARETEAKTRAYQIPGDETTQRVIFDLSHRPSYVGQVARDIWEALQRERERRLEDGQELGGDFVIPETLARTIAPEMWAALEYEMEDERICRGEITPRVREFIESRQQLAGCVRAIKERVGWEWVKTTHELLPEKDKENSVLFQELNTVLQNVVRELGFQRPVSLEITRNEDFNAFVMTVAREGGLEATSQVPLRVFVNAGFMHHAETALQMDGKTFTPDHLAFILGHELAHLKQAGYDPDHPPRDEEERQRYEYDADTTGLEAADRAGYNPRAGLELLAAVQKRVGRWDILNHYFQKTHPVTENRVKELWQIYQRPDQPFFSAGKKFDAFSPQVWQETRQLLRSEWQADIRKAVTYEDWQAILERLETDPRMTLKDAELVGSQLRGYLDTRVALSAALHDLDTESGLADMILLQANLALWREEQRAKEASQPPDPSPPSASPSWPWDNLFPDGGTAIRIRRSGYNVISRDMVGRESMSGVRQDFSPECVRTEAVKVVNKYHLEQHTDGVDVRGRYIKSLKELFDVDNPTALDFWKNYFAHSRVSQPADFQGNPEAYVLEGRRPALEWMASTYLLGVSNEITRRGDDLKNTLAFIEKLRAGSADTATGPEVSAGLLDGKLWGQVSQAVEGRLAGYRAPSKDAPPPPAEAAKKPEKSETFSVCERLLNIRPYVPAQAYQPKQSSPVDGTPLQTLAWRYIQAARDIFDRELSSANIAEDFGIDVQENAQAKQLIFEGVFAGVVADSERATSSFRRLKLSELRAMPELFDYLRCLSVKTVPLAIDDDEILRTKRAPFTTLLRIGLADRGLTNTEAAIGERLQRVRIARLHPNLLDGRYEAAGRYEADGDVYFEDQGMAEARKTNHNLLTLKRVLFQDYLRLGWRGPDSRGQRASQRQQQQRLKEALETRAQAEGLPRDFFWMRELHLGSLRGLMRTVGITPEKEAKAQRRTLNRMFSLEFMRLLADDEQEMSECSASTMRLVE